jgi:hypothetical protein
MAQAAPPRVVIVSENAETVDGLQRYLVGVGINAQSAGGLAATANLPERTTAVVIFPDGFNAEDVLGHVRALHRNRPRLLLLLVTRDARRFSEALASKQRDPPVLILPKPAFGWTIVDAVRLHAQALATTSAN